MERNRYLYLMRHAQAECDSDVVDFKRKLTVRGQQQIQMQMAQFKLSDGIRPDCVLCSTAERTVQTANQLKNLFRGIPVFCRETLYLAPTYRLMDLIHDTDDIFYRLLIIGHNPGLEQLCGILDKNQVRISLQPADCVCIRLNVRSWRDIRPETGKVKKIFVSGA